MRQVAQRYLDPNTWKSWLKRKLCLHLCQFSCSYRVFWGFCCWIRAQVTLGICPMTGAAAGSYAYILITLQMEWKEVIMNYYRKLGFKFWQHDENKLQIMLFLIKMIKDIVVSFIMSNKYIFKIITQIL